MAITIYEPLNTHLTAILNNYVTSTATNVMQQIQPVGTTILLLGISWYGWSMMCGMINTPIIPTVQRMLKYCVIFAISTNITLYNEFLANWLLQTPDALANLITGNGGNSSNVSFSFLDTLLSEYFERGLVFWDLGNASTIPNFGFLIIAGVIWLAGFLVTGYAAFMLIMSKIAISVLLSVGAIFVMLTVFDVTRKFFDAWIGQVVNFIFLNMLTVAVASIMLSIIRSYTQGMTSAADIADVFPMFGLSLITVYLLYQVPSIASSLGGGVALSTLGAGTSALNFARNFEPRKLSESRKNLNTNAGIISRQTLNKAVGMPTRKNAIKER
jgi:type IV secretion system protein VirB6